MLKRNLLAQAIALAIVLPGVSYAEFEISGEAKIEYSLFTSDGMVTGDTEEHSAGDAMKSEYGVKLFMNADVGEESAFHAELLFADDGEAASDRLEGGEEYSQYEILRELYLDTSAGGWDFRLGKQQVVWGTADGIKLLDIINPTDYRELNQNVSEDSRIPVWMINAEKYFDSGDSIQFIISEAQPNFIAGLDADGDSGAPFIFKGVDTITGDINGFLNIGKDMGKTAGVFQTLLGMGGLGGAGGTSPLSTGPMSLLTVSGFTSLGTGAPNRTFDQVGQALNATGNFDADGDSVNETVALIDLTTGAPIAFAPPPLADGTAYQFVSPTLTPDNPANAANNALLNVVFLPFMNQLGTGNNVLAAAANTSGDLLNNFATYLQGAQTAAAGGLDFDSNGDGTLDIPNAQLNTALGALFTQMNGSVLANLGLQGVDTSNATQVAGALTEGSTQTVDAADVTGVTPVYQQAVQEVAIAGLQQTFFSNSTTNQFDGTLSPDAPTSTFDYMGNTSFGTFESFIGMTTEYRKDYDTDPFSESNLGFRYKGSTEGGTNFSLNYAYRMDSNPYVDIHWEDSSGNLLTAVKRTTAIDALGQPLDFDGDGTVDSPNPQAATVTTVSLQNTDGSAFDSSGGNPATWGANPANLVFVEKLNRINTLGFSFDTAIDGSAVPIVLRGEFSYDIETKQPVVNLDELDIGNITEALKMEDADIFKYVLGVDVTVLTNLLVSTQLIQFYNLDYIDDGNRYTGDFSSMDLTNGLKKGDEVETFISLFLSKPFGPDVQHRWNNILIFENDGGYWNRFDVEYSFNDDMIGTIELNNYWGDEDTTFGQFKDSSNLQLGFKYLF